MKPIVYIFWILIFPFIGAWIIHFNIIGVLATVGQSPSYYTGAGAGWAWFIFYTVIFILSTVVVYAYEKEYNERNKNK
jgi:hypothetical protein